MKNRRICIAFFLIALSFSLPAVGGNESPHGGDGITCFRSPYNSLEGFYALDFVAYHIKEFVNFGSIPRELARARSADEALNWIQIRLDAKLPRLGQSLTEFRKHIFKRDPSAPQDWVPSRDLDYIYDQGLWQGGVIHLPINCKFRNIEQLVVRQVENGRTIFYFDRDAIGRLDPLQESFLLIHEWLREFGQDPNWIRGVNRLFHSRFLDILSQRELWSEIRNADG